MIGEFHRGDRGGYIERTEKMLEAMKAQSAKQLENNVGRCYLGKISGYKGMGGVRKNGSGCLIICNNVPNFGKIIRGDNCSIEQQQKKSNFLHS